MVPSRRRQLIALLLGLALPSTSAAAGAPPSSGPAVAHSDQRLAELGRQIYEQGVLASGRPLRAVVQRDVQVEGTQITCRDCHQRSGMGWVEGQTQVPPVTGRFLYQPGNPRRRPAYTDQTLARAIRDGIGAAGRPLSRVMPRYRMADRDVQALIAYLKTLSTDISPGVTESTIHFATVVSDRAPPRARKAMLDVLEEFFREKNSNIRLETRRARVETYFKPRLNVAYRKWVLNVWTLEGSRATWTTQLDAYYEQRPVFALISGLATGHWHPIHEFCERHRVPCLLPNTDLPAVGEEGSYTLYFSKGLALEAQAIAEHLSRAPAGLRLLQVFREDAPGSVGARAFRGALGGDKAVVVDLPLSGDGRLPPELVAERIEATNSTAVVLWLSREDLAAIDWRPGSVRVYLSSTLLDGEVSAVPPAIRGTTLVAHPFSLPDALQPSRGRLEAWLKRRGIDLVDPRIQAQTYFACAVVGDGFTHIGSYFYRDYFLETIDHLTGTPLLLSIYPRPTFGPGQRYLAKGCYLLELGKDTLIEKASWLTLGG